MKNRLKRNVAIFFAAFLFAVGTFAPANIARAASGGSTVYITKTGECYHLDGCSSLRRSKIATTLQAAVDKGLRPCSKCKPGSLDASPAVQNDVASKATNATADVKTASSTATATVNPSVEALKNYKGNTKSFSAYDYYMNNADLQVAVGADGDALLKHYNKYGKKEGRVAISSNSATSTIKTNSSVEALKTYKGNTKDFNAYVYYSNNTDLQVAIGADGDALLKHYNEYGKSEGRIAK